MRKIFDGEPMGNRINVVSVSSIGELNSLVSGITASHQVIGSGGNVARTLLTLTNVSQSVVAASRYQSSKLWTFPEGRILLFDAKFNLTQKTTSAIASTINSGVTGAVSLGTAAAGSTTLNSTAADLIASQAFVSSTTINVAGTAVEAQLDTNGDFSEQLNLDGTSAAKSVYLNSAFATAADVDADGTQAWNGTIELFWMLGSYSLRV